jgi:hypothetical protein
MKLLVILLFPILLFAQNNPAPFRIVPVAAPANEITYDTTASYSVDDSGSPITFTHPVGSVSNQCSFYGFEWYPSSTAIDSVVIDGTGGGQATLVGNKASSNGTNTASLYRRLSVQSGSRTCKVYFHGTTLYMAMGHVSFAGVDQTTPTDTVATNATIGGSPDVSPIVYITRPTNYWIVDVEGNGANKTGTAAAGQSKKCEVANADGEIVTMSVRASAGATQSYTLSGAANWSMLAAQVKPQVFKPTDSSNCVLWLCADSISGLSNGDAVATWSNKGAWSVDYAQSNASYRPTYSTNAINGHSAVTWASNNQYLESASLPAADINGATIFVVMKFTDADTYTFLQFGGSNNLIRAYFTASQVQWYDSPSGAYQIGTASTSFFKFCDSTCTNALIRTGSNWLLGGWFNGQIAEVIVYSGSRTATLRNTVAGYINSRYGL